MRITPMEHLATPSSQVSANTSLPPTPAARTLTIPLNTQSALVGFAVALLLALGIETYQLIAIRGALARGPVGAPAASLPAAAPAPSALDQLPQMSGGC